MIYDIIIIGGGMSGLYTQYKLLKKNKNKKILLIEKNGRLGGRVYTDKIKVNNHHYNIEAGAGRFNDNHVYLKKLIRDLKLQNKIIKIPSSVNHIPTKNKWKNSEITKYSPYDYLDYIINNIELTHSMKGISFIEWLNKNVSKNIVDYLKDFYPYKDIFKINAYDALNLYKIDLNVNNTFYALSGGLSQLIDGMENYIRKSKGIIVLNTELKSINNIEENYLLKTNNKNYICKKVVLTGQRPDLLKIKYLNKIKPLIKSVRNAPLCRFYFIFDTKKCAWFKNIKKTITDSRLSYFIPIDYNKGLVMISYVDEYNAKFLKKMEMKSETKLVNFLLKECEKIFGISNIPKPIWNKSYYWESGVGDWNPGFDSKVVEKAMTKPFKDENLFICGENYSAKFQCWIEGALNTSEKVLKKLN